LPLALLEAMALGRPPVATRVGGVTQVIEDGVSGFLVDPRDPNTEADRIVELMDSPALRERVGAAAAERASRFDVRRAVGRIEQVYGELIA
jgi:glycosyltransferase involved in cell wall biosynthesis